MVGGDCTVLVGALAAAKERLGRVGLAFVDGHLDYFGGETSPGEAADMDLAFVTGHGLEGQVNLAGLRWPGRETSWSWGTAPIPRKEPSRNRPGRREDPVGRGACDQAGIPKAGALCRREAQAQAGHFWLHFDVDVFDQAEMPAVTVTRRAQLGARGGAAAPASRVSEARWPLGSRLRPRQRPGRKVRAPPGRSRGRSLRTTAGIDLSGSAPFRNFG